MNELGTINLDGTVTCYCGAPMEKRSSIHGEFYGCSRFPNCDGLVGTHKDTGFPLGLPAPQATRTARQIAHATFDLLWKSNLMKRGNAYAWLRAQLYMTQDECHIGRFNARTCNLVVQMAELKLDELDLGWREREAKALADTRRLMVEQAVRESEAAAARKLYDDLPPLPDDDDIPF